VTDSRSAQPHVAGHEQFRPLVVFHRSLFHMDQGCSSVESTASSGLRRRPLTAGARPRDHPGAVTAAVVRARVTVGIAVRIANEAGSGSQCWMEGRAVMSEPAGADGRQGRGGHAKDF
jgi:hypothetical protein